MPGTTVMARSPIRAGGKTSELCAGTSGTWRTGPRTSRRKMPVFSVCSGLRATVDPQQPGVAGWKEEVDDLFPAEFFFRVATKALLSLSSTEKESW